VRATSAPNTYVFTELLQTPQVQALASSDELAPHLALLQIFSHGTYSSYISTPGLPALNDAQQLKLRQLSLLTLAKNDTSTNKAGRPALDYASLQKALDLPSRQALEELVISAIYAGLLKAQLNPRASLVQINSVSPLRDVAPTAIGGLLSSLEAWAGRCDSTLESLSNQMAQLQADADRRAAKAATRREVTQSLVEYEKGAQAPHTSSHLPRATAAAAANAANAAAPRRDPRVGVFSHTYHAQPTTHPDAGGGNNTNTNTNNEMNPVLTVGGGSFLPSSAGSSVGPGAAAAGAPHLQMNSSVLKRGSGQMDGGADGAGMDGEDVDMENADDDGLDGQKRASKRKLDP
jgi:COP9 signalosome complex subunit 7